MGYTNSTAFGGLLPEATLEQSAAWAAGHPDRITTLKAPCPVDRPGYTAPPPSYLDSYFDPIAVPDIGSVPRGHPDNQFFVMCRKWNRGVAKQRALERRLCRQHDHIPPGQYADYAARVSKRYGGGSPRPPKPAPRGTAVEQATIAALLARVAQLEASIIPGAHVAPQPEGPKLPAKLSLKQQRTLQAQRDLARLHAEQQRRQAQREQWAQQRERFPTR